jgi:hypothetical protein
MSQVPFVEMLGDAIEEAIARDARPAPSRRMPRIRALRCRHRLGVVLVALVIGGAAVAVAETLQSPTALVTGGIVCYAGTSTGASVEMYANVEANGRTPETACADVFRTDGPAPLARPGVRLTACADPNGFVAVFKATGAANQCGAQGMSPLAARSYAVAQSSVDHLVQALTDLGANRACIAPSLLVRDVQGVLDRLGWSGWRAKLQTQPSGSGSCGLFLGTGSSFSDPTASLDASKHVVWITAGPIPSLIALTAPLDRELLQASGRRCYTTAGVHLLVADALASARVQIRFAVTQEPKGGGWAYAQQAYDRGCAIVVAITPAPYGRIADVWLNSKGGPAEPFGGGPSPSQFH